MFHWTSLGRNGGHLTPGLFLDFSSHVKDMGTSEGLKQYALERHSVTDILRIIKENGLEETVDLVSGGHIDLMFSEEELEVAQEDFRLAQEAGADLSEAQWFTAEEMEKVGITITELSHRSLTMHRLTAQNMLL